jgi:ribosome-associated protein
VATDPARDPRPARPADPASDDVVRVSGALAIPRRELDVRFTTSGGPGGQHANRTATRVELTFDVAASPSLSEAQRSRLLERVGEVVRVVADDERSQARNRVIAERRLAERLAAALRVDRPRRATRPSRASVDRRIAAKKRRGETKATRRRPPPD